MKILVYGIVTKCQKFIGHGKNLVDEAWNRSPSIGGIVLI